MRNNCPQKIQPFSPYLDLAFSPLLFFSSLFSSSPSTHRPPVRSINPSFFQYIFSFPHFFWNIIPPFPFTDFLKRRTELGNEFSFLLKHENLFSYPIQSITTKGHVSPQGHETRVETTHSEKGILLYTFHTLILPIHLTLSTVCNLLSSIHVHLGSNFKVKIS